MAFDPAQLQLPMSMSVFLAELYMMKIQDASAIAQGMHACFLGENGLSNRHAEQQAVWLP